MRRASRVLVACARLRARRKLGTAIDASKAMMATTIMISTRVKPLRLDWWISIAWYNGIRTIPLEQSPCRLDEIPFILGSILKNESARTEEFSVLREILVSTFRL